MPHSYWLRGNNKTLVMHCVFVLFLSCQRPRSPFPFVLSVQFAPLYSHLLNENREPYLYQRQRYKTKQFTEAHPRTPVAPSSSTNARLSISRGRTIQHCLPRFPTKIVPHSSRFRDFRSARQQGHTKMPNKADQKKKKS